MASSHFCAGARAADAGCVTSEDSLKDPNGRLNKLMLCQGDKLYLDLINNGWEWTIIPRAAEEIFPWFPDLAQGAPNAEQTTFTTASEMQVMMNIANQASPELSTWKDIIASIQATAPSCAAYLPTLAEFVQRFSGGPGAPIVLYLEGFAK